MIEIVTNPTRVKIVKMVAKEALNAAHAAVPIQITNVTRIEATAAGGAEWTEHVLALGEGQLMNEIGSWMTGVNGNVEGKQKPRIMRYSGGHPAYREHCDAVAADGYRTLALA